MKKTFWLLPVATMLAFVACSSDSSSTSASNEDVPMSSAISEDDGNLSSSSVMSDQEEKSSSSMESSGSLPEANYMIVDKGTYKIEENTLNFQLPQCEVVNGRLVWSKDGGEIYPYLYDYDKSSGLISVVDDEDERMNMEYVGSSFPVGSWIATEEENGIKIGFALESDKNANLVAYYGCFMESALGNKVFDEEYQAVEIIDCETVDVAGMQLKVKSATTSSMSLEYSVGSVSCPIEMNMRYAINETDCKAAYEEYKVDDEAEDEFYFDEYMEEIVSDDACMMSMVLELMKGLCPDGECNFGDFDMPALAKQASASNPAADKIALAKKIAMVVTKAVVK